MTFLLLNFLQSSYAIWIIRSRLMKSLRYVIFIWIYFLLVMEQVLLFYSYSFPKNVKFLNFNGSHYSPWKWRNTKYGCFVIKWRMGGKFVLSTFPFINVLLLLVLYEMYTLFHYLSHVLNLIVECEFLKSREII